jgi:hypothetical protein
MDWDWKFWSTFAATVIGLGIMGWQVRIMKQQITALPSARNANRAKLERQITKRLYTPVFIMAGLVLMSWLPYVLMGGPGADRIPLLIVAWSGAENGCNAAVDTSGIAKASEKYRLFLVCHITNPAVDQLEDESIAISKPFNITGGLVQILILYPPGSEITKVAKLGTQTTHTLVLLPKDKDGSTIRKLSDVSREGGQIILPGGKKNF